MKKLFNIFKNHILNYPTPRGLNFNWGYGSIAGIFLIIQLITGVLLAFHYVPHPEEAFFSIERLIMRDVHNGWLIRYMHMNGASFFFLAVYFHMARSLYYRAYLINVNAWYTGVAIFVVLMATAFLGYVLPWSQMSYWAATVITNLFSSIPVFGQKIVYWLWGGFSVNANTLKRFYALHMLLSALLSVLVIVHIYFVHISGSISPLSIKSLGDDLKFSTYFGSKDLFGLMVIGFIFMTVVLLYPLYLAHPDQFIKADVLVTPKHIVPEWYFLPFHAILRSVPNKNLGILLLIASIGALLFLPKIDKTVIAANAKLSVYYEFLFFFFMYTCFTLGYLGSMPATEPYVWASKLFTFFYFAFFVLLFLFSQFSNHSLMEIVMRGGTKKKI